MGVQLNDDEMRAHLVRIVNADGEAARKAAADALILDLHSKEVLELWGRNLARHFGRPSDHEEVTSVITEALLMLARNLTADELAKVRQVASYLYFRAKAAVTGWLDSPAVTLATEMSGISRRHRMARVAVRELREKLGREPEPAEVVRFVNERAMASRKDASKQGALITVDDVDGMQLRSYSMDYSGGDDSDMNDSFGTPDDGGVTLAAEASLTVAQLEQRADVALKPAEATEVKRVLSVWVRLVMAGETPTAVAISKALGLSRRSASARLTQVNGLLQDFRDAAAA